MKHTPKNIQQNPRVVITAFNKNWVGLRIFGTAKFHTDGPYYDFCMKEFFSEGQITPFGATKPKGAIVVTIDRIEELK